MLVQRLGNWQTNINKVKKFIQLIKRNKESCDEVWFSSLYGYPPIEEHKKLANKLMPVAKILRENNIKVSLQISNTIGHGEYMSTKDCSALVNKNSHVQNLVSSDGTIAKYSFCWNDLIFRNYIKNVLNAYSILKPDMVWFDDDLRITGHMPAKNGCFCDNCISKFNNKYNYNFNRESLISELSNNIDLRKKYIDFQKQGLSSFVYDFCSDFHKVCPDTVFGHQNASICINMDGDSYILDAMKNASTFCPAVRPGGGSYDDAVPLSILSKYFQVAIGNCKLPDYVENISPEIENLPYVAFGKSSYGTAFESTLYFAGGATGMTYAMMMHEREPLKFYNNFFKEFSKRRSYWDFLVSINRQSRQSGLCYVTPSSTVCREKQENESALQAVNKVLAVPPLYDTPTWFSRIGIPLAFRNNSSNISILCNEVIDYLTNEEIAELLKNPCLCDGLAFEKLCKKGEYFNCKAEKISDFEATRLQYKYTDNSLCEKLKGKTINKTWGGSNLIRIIPKDKDFYPLAQYFATTKEIKSQGGKFGYGIADAVIKTKFGAKWAVFGENIWNWQIPYSRKKFYLEIIKFITGKNLNAEIINSQACCILPRENKQGKLIAVSILNPSINTLKPKIILRNTLSKNFFYINEFGKEKKLQYIEKENEIFLELPNLAAWHISSVFCK